MLLIPGRRQITTMFLFRDFQRSIVVEQDTLGCAVAEVVVLAAAQ